MLEQTMPLDSGGVTLLICIDGLAVLFGAPPEAARDGAAVEGEVL